MKTLHRLKLSLLALFLGGAVAFAAPGAMCEKNCVHSGKGVMCQKKNCTHKLNGTNCNQKSCMNKTNGAMCDKKSCLHKKGMKSRSLFLKNIRYTLKNLKISQSDWRDVKLAFASYKTDLKRINLVTPLKSLQNGKFDRKLFVNSHPVHQKISAQADLIETIFLILNSDQKKRFVMLMGASQHYFKLHPNMCNSSGKRCN